MKVYDTGCFSRVREASLEGGFFGPIVRGVRDRMIPHQWKALNDQAEGGEKSFCIRNFRVAVGLEQGEHGGFVFQDSDLAKWLEAVAYQLCLRPDPELEALADGAIGLIEQAQMPDGYLNTYYQLTDISKRWTNLRDDHELYTAGHMIEAAVAYYQATGKDRLLRVMERMAAHIMGVLGPEEGQKHGTPGTRRSSELCKPRRRSAEEYLRLAAYFIHQQAGAQLLRAGAAPGGGTEPGRAYGYLRAASPAAGGPGDLEAMSGAVPAVRAAGVAMRTGDESLQEACVRLYRNLTGRRMYLTGGVGSSHLGEALTFDYDLPSDTAYAETCASVALVFLCRRMLETDVRGEYADTMERALYNTCLAGMSLDMERFFYVNPLACVPEASKKDDRKRHVLPERPGWFGCACCPPNLARLLSSLPLYAFSVRGRTVCIHLFLQGRFTLQTEGGPVRLRVQTGYPRDGRVRILLEEGACDLMLHLPAWCGDFRLSLNGVKLDAAPEQGYLPVPGCMAGAEAELDLRLQPRRVYASERVREEIGKTALQRGPVVFCLEEADNGPGLHQLSLDRASPLRFREDPGLPGGMAIQAEGWRQTPAGEALYPDAPGRKERAGLTFIPYHAWANRGENEMSVWVREG